ncbi:beta family protein [Streptomyces lasiicapitis]|uniref:beta family protein n=1 Tax=Streptomyces lasiicapitis TaxID=1923961 RepID=UPI0036AF85CB
MNGAEGEAVMPGPLYVPMLPARPHAAGAYRRLSPDIQRDVVPLWNLPLRTGLGPSELGAAFRGDLRVVTKVQRYHPAWLDAPFAEDSQRSVLAPLLQRVVAEAPLRPVTGPERARQQQVWAWETARRSGDGLGVRVRMEEQWDADVTGNVRDLLAQADLAVAVDLLLDLARVLSDRPEAGKEALKALDALVPLAPWRTVAVIGGGMPSVTADMLTQGLHDAPRVEWTAWCEATDSGRSYSPLLTYGDYGIQPASDLARVASAGKGGPPWGLLRYTTEQSYVVAKMLARGGDRTAHNRAMARGLFETPGFRSPGASAGEAWIRDCAQGLGGTGNFGTWLWVGAAQHMTYIVRSLRLSNAS